MSARSKSTPGEVKAGVFKAKCLELMDVVARTGTSIVITKRGTPVARLIPAVDRTTSVFGFAKGSFEEAGDILSPVPPEWRPNEDELALLDTDSSHPAPRASRSRRRHP
jgi:prevent-host-death family protein